MLRRATYLTVKRRYGGGGLFQRLSTGHVTSLVAVFLVETERLQIVKALHLHGTKKLSLTRHHPVFLLIFLANLYFSL